MAHENWQIVIIGGGPAGMSAALWAKRLGCEPLLVEAGAEPGGQLLRTFNRLVDCPGFLGQTGAEIARQVAEHLKTLAVAVRLRSPVTRLSLAENLVWFDSEAISYQALILTLGVQKRRLGIPGEEEFAGRGVSTSATRDKHLYRGKSVAIVGGGDGAFEEALMLAEEGCRVTLIHRSDRFRARPMYRDPVLVHPQIRVLTCARLTEIVGTTAVTGVNLEIAQPGGPVETMHLPLAGVFLTLGTNPATQLTAGQLELDSEGYIVTDRYGATSAAGVWAAGDACRPLLPSLVTAFGDGATTAKAAFDWLHHPKES
ncbi:MAG: FAD-dependent oxidoreductase [Blastocatellia bacterium]|nr:FAD-dependent oxidoreductase [Blastocatellia bacterium]